MKGEPITIRGEGTRTRPFHQVGDLIEDMRRLMEVEGDEPGPLNLVNPGEFTVIEEAEMVIRLTGSSSRNIHQPLSADVSPTSPRPSPS